MKQRKKAAALKYEENIIAPVVSAVGMGQIADKIIEKAEEPIREAETYLNRLEQETQQWRT